MNVRGNDTAQTPSDESEALALLLLLLWEKITTWDTGIDFAHYFDRAHKTVTFLLYNFSTTVVSLCVFFFEIKQNSLPVRRS